MLPEYGGAGNYPKKTGNHCLPALISHRSLPAERDSRHRDFASRDASRSAENNEGGDHHDEDGPEMHDRDQKVEGALT